MKKLKILLLFSVLIIIIIFRFFNYSNSINDINYISGTVKEINKKDDGVNVVIKGKRNVLIYFDDFPNLKLGMYIEVYGKSFVPNNNTVFNLFNYKKYLLSKGISFCFKADRFNIISDRIPLKYKIKNKIIDRIESYKSKEYLKAFILGDTSDIDDTSMKSYRLNGISHLFAISGLHIGIITGFLFFVLNRIFNNKDYSYCLIICFLFFYLFMTDYSPSVVRTSMFFVFNYINHLFDLKIKSFFVLLLVFLLLLIINPFMIYNTGFLLSFVVSFFIIIFGNIHNFNSYFFRSLWISFIAFLSSFPIIINSYHEINILSPFFSTFFGFFVSFFLFPLSLITFFISLFDNFLFTIFGFFEAFCNKISPYSMFNISFCQMSLFHIIIYYFLIINILILFSRGKNYLIFLIFLFFIHFNLNYFDFSSSVHFIDVGQGDSILIKIYNKNILIDTGGSVDNDFKIAENKLIPYFKSLGVKKIHFLVISHGDFDHGGEAINLVNNFKVEKVIFNCGPYNGLEKDLINVLEKKKIKYYSCVKELDIDKNKFYFLQTKEYDNENDNSNIIYTELNGYKFMFMGDASISTEKVLMNKYNLINIDALKVGHHGSRTSSSEKFINEINPKFSIISVGKNNRYGHPNKEVLNNLENSKIYRTDQDGSIMFKIRNSKLKIETCLP